MCVHNTALLRIPSFSIEVPIHACIVWLNFPQLSIFDDSFPHWNMFFSVEFSQFSFVTKATNCLCTFLSVTIVTVDIMLFILFFYSSDDFSGWPCLKTRFANVIFLLNYSFFSYFVELLSKAQAAHSSMEFRIDFSPVHCWFIKMKQFSNRIWICWFNAIYYAFNNT